MGMRTHAQLIKDLGGGTALAEAARARGFALERNRVYRWTHDDNIAWRWRHLVAEIAATRGVTLPANFLMPPVVSDEANDLPQTHVPDLPVRESLRAGNDEQIVSILEAAP